MLYKFMTDGEIVVKIVRGENDKYIVYHKGEEVGSYALVSNAAFFANKIMRKVAMS